MSPAPTKTRLDIPSHISDISVMTETSELKQPLPAAIQRFILHWGEMGETWGVNRSVSQIHALLYTSASPMTAEEIADALSLARSNVSNSLRELLGWNLIRRVGVLGDRRDYYEAEADMLEMVRRIAIGRKARELDPALAALRQCAAEADRDRAIPPAVRQRFRQMLEVVEGVDSGFTEIMRLPPAVLLRLIRMGGTVARLLAPRGLRARKG
jgi:DNA-binding transcriptional regulator GbsR (MarR family)